MKKIILGLLTLLAIGSTAAAQTLPPNTVMGRLGIGPGPAQAIPFTTLGPILFGSGSGIFGLTLSGDTNYAMVTTDRTVLINANLTAPRTVTLFAAALLATGQQICIADAFGGVTSTNTVTIARSSTDTINGATSYVLSTAFGGECLVSDGVSKWTVGKPQNIANASLATMPANTVKCNPTTSTATPVDCAFPVLNVKDYGAVCANSGNDATAFNNAIAALPATGGVVEFSGNCRITSAIVIGNGTSSVASTRQGVILRGIGVVGNPVFPGYTATGGPKITWAGTTGVQGIVQVNGPLQGYGLENMLVDCSGTSGVFGIVVTSASFGDNKNIVTTGCERGIVSTTVALFGAFTNLDSIHTSWLNTTVNIPAVAGSIGILLSGTASGNSNTDYNNFYNVHISGPTSVVAVTGILLQSTDTVHFYQTHLSGFNASATCIQMDYSVASNFPSSTRFVGLDVGNNCNGGAAYAVNGTPGAAAKANQFLIDGANNTVCPAATLVNVSCISNNQFITNPNGNNAGVDILGAWSTFTPSAACGTATFTTNTGRRSTAGKTTRISVNIQINALGTCTNNLTFTLPVANQSFGSLSGRDANTGRNTSCQLVGTATAACSQYDAGNYAAGANILISGVYENQ